MRRIPLPDHLVEQAAEFTSGARTPVEPRDAATVVVLRPGPEGPEAYLLRRQVSMAFAGGFCVFPGGGVDQRDFEHAEGLFDNWAGPSPAEWAARLGTDEAMAVALVCAAVRETFEESGVLLAGPTPDQVVADTTGADWEADRVALESKELSLSEFLERRDLLLRTDLLGVWSGWLTPAFEPRRYRTWFFVADLPEGQVTRDVSSESAEVMWLPTAHAVDRVESGDLFMLPPTYLTCLEISLHADPDAVLAAAQGRTVEMFMPEVEHVDGVAMLTIPPYAARLAEEAAGRALPSGYEAPPGFVDHDRRFS
jgi:8-oxo-dGTP pyrophosphatase MutT (NUDIX family)